MPITQQDIQPFIPSNVVNPNQFIPPNYYQGNLPSSGGMPQGGNGIGSFGSFALNNVGPGFGNFVDYLSGNENAFDPISLLTGGLFGGDEPSWQTYIKDGMVYYADPSKKNPVPVPIVPGAGIEPSKQYRQTANDVQAITDLLPYFSGAVNATLLPQEMAKLQAAQQTSGPYAQLMTELYNQYGPQLNAIGNEITRRNALAQAETDKSVIEGPGGDLVRKAYELSQVYDKPFYDTRAASAGRLQDLLSSIDLSGGLSTTERDEVAKGLAREGQQRGTALAPSATDTVANAMRYGEKGYQRKTQAQDALTKAIQASAAFLPASKSGVDVFQVATGRSSMPNPGNSQFTGINTGNTSQGAQLGNQIFGGMNSLQQAQMQIDANKKDWLDMMNQFTSSMKDVGSMAGGFMGMVGCWVAREVYGNNNPKWLQFRYWLFNKAPMWLFKLYMIYGEKFAKFISDKPVLKSIIRRWMNTKLKFCKNECYLL